MAKLSAAIKNVEIKASPEQQQRRRRLR